MSFRPAAARFFWLLSLLFAVHVYAAAQNPYENRTISRIDITFQGADRDVSAAEQFRSVAGDALGETYSTVRVRDAIEKLYETDRIVSASVEASLVGDSQVSLRFLILRKSIVRKTSVILANSIGEEVTEQELRLQINLLSPGTTISDKILRENSNQILTYLRDRGFFDAKVEFKQIPLENEKEVLIEFDVKPGAQAKVDSFELDIRGINSEELKQTIKLMPGTLYSRSRLVDDIDQIRLRLQEKGFLAPTLLEPRVIYDSDRNTIDIELQGQVGAEVEVTVDSTEEKVGEKTQRRLLPVKREGTLDYSAIVEGQRRLETHYQEKGYFFARVRPVCSVNPPFKADEASETENNTEALCTALSGSDLTDRKVEVRYETDLNRKLRLDDLRVEGTDLFTIAEIQAVLQSQPASVLGFIPFFGYGRGYTSLELLQRDQATILSLLRELGYRDARVGVKQGVSPNGEDLIITFVIRQGRPTKIVDVAIEGNTQISTGTLLSQLPVLKSRNYSRALVRNGVRKLSQYYANQGYFYSSVSSTIVELPNGENAENDEVKVVYKIESEGEPVYVNRVLLNGNEITRSDSITNLLEVQPDKPLKQLDIFASEQRLYTTDAFEQVEFVTQPAGELQNGKGNLADVIVNVQEKKPIVTTWGGGYATDVGLSGFFDVRHFNLFGKLQQGGAQIRWSQRQQLLQVDFIDPRFWRDGRDQNGNKRFAPLKFTAQYRRDSTVTRFFRSAFDRGTFGIVQRIDDTGMPIDEFGNSAGDPTLNRFTLSLETNRTFGRDSRTILFLKYRYEDVRLLNFESLLIRELLRPDARIRVSGFSATFVRDTRRNCSVRYTLLDIIDKGEEGDPCRYSAGDPTAGDYLTAFYDFSSPILGGNIGFNKLQLSYNRYFTVNALANTTFAARTILGMANVFAKGQRFTSTQFPGLDGSLPISERFFAGGSTTLRGFEFEAAGPRVVVVPQGTYRNSSGEIVSLDPFTIPFGGNALAVVNLEARIPMTENVRAVPFYDGGNVYNRIGEVFNPSSPPPNDVFETNRRAMWTHTAGLGLRIKTPIGGEFAVDYGYLLNPPQFLIPQQIGPNAIYRLRQGQFHFRFSQAF